MKQQKTQDRQMRVFHTILGILTIITLLNLLLTASIVGLIGSVVILVMIWGIRKGDYPLTKALGWFLLIYAGSNLAVLVISLLSGAKVHLSALVWLGLYSMILLFCGMLLRHRILLEYLKTAPAPPEKKHKITFFRGGWRDL